MSTISFLKFTIKDLSEENLNNINSIIIDYLKRFNFEYNKEKMCYINTQPMYFLRDVLCNFQYNRCFEYKIIENKLIIKAYLLNIDLDCKIHIHTYSYHYTHPAFNYNLFLRDTLFNILKQNNVYLKNKEIEKINDGKSEQKVRFHGGMKLLRFFYKVLFIVISVLVIFLLLLFIFNLIFS